MPWLGLADTKVRPAGSGSVIRTPVAVLGPLLVRVTVKVMVSPTLGVASLTVFVTARSARCGVSVALAVLLLELGSNWSAAATVAVLVRASRLVTVAVIVKVCGLAGLTAPTSHVPAAE